MDALKIQAKDFDTRDQLDRYVALECGKDSLLNRSAGHQIVGMSGDLSRLGLSEDVVVYGIRVVLLNE